jgi:hypothetical protein
MPKYGPFSIRCSGFVILNPNQRIFNPFKMKMAIDIACTGILKIFGPSLAITSEMVIGI